MKLREQMQQLVSHSVELAYSDGLDELEPLEVLALDLPERERAALADNLLNSLPGILSDEDEGLAEALRRDAEI